MSVTIGISIYKQPIAWVHQCIHSCINQTYENITIRVRADGLESISNKDLKELQYFYQEYANIVITTGDNLGTFGSYKKIFEGCTTEFIAQVDADDWLEKDAIQEVVQCAKEQLDIVLVHTDHRRCYNNRKTDIKKSRETTRWNLLSEFSAFHLRLIRTKAYHLVEGYNEELITCGDYDLALKVSEKGEIRQINRPLYNYRIHNSNHSLLARQELINESIEVVQRAITRRMLNGTKNVNACRETGSIHIIDNCLVSDQEVLNHENTDGYCGILVAGMHRSKTSWVAKVLHENGISMGQNLLSADANNPLGYFEDIEMLKLNMQTLSNKACSFKRRKSHDNAPIWKSNEFRLAKHGKLDSVIPTIEESIELSDRIMMKSAYSSRCFAAKFTHSWWGWKDPRSTLLLNAWKSVSPGMTAILCFRHPDQTCRSLMRWDGIVENNQVAYNYYLSLWIKYNTRIVNYKKRWPTDTLLVNTQNHQSVLSIDKEIKRLWGLKRSVLDQEWRVGESIKTWSPNASLKLQEQSEEIYEMLNSQ